ncbi:MAG: hypothetical protein ACYCZ0_04350 [Minisyncoccota bacterium]
MALTPEQLRAEIDRLLEAGDESALKDFMLEHFSELPESAQGEMLLASFSDAVTARLADAKIADLQDSALAAIDALEAPEDGEKSEK